MLSNGELSEQESLTSGEALAKELSGDVIVQVEDVVKTYRVYSRPHFRLLQGLADRRGSGKSYCFEVPAVKGVSFALKQGEAIAIIGRNGSGKSTLLEMIAGTLAPTSGSVELNGRVSALLELGAGFNPDFTGRHNIRVNASIQGLTEKQIKAIEPQIEAFAEIGEFIDEPVRTYSSGMYVRLAFATAVHVVPDLLIVDEALAVGDIFFQQKCFEYLANELADATKIIVTHDLASAVRLADRCIVLEKGDVVFDGPPLEAVEIYTALHLGDRSSSAKSDIEVEADAISKVEEPVDLNEADRARPSNAEAYDVLGAGIKELVNGQARPLSSAAVVANPDTDYLLQFEVAVGRAVENPVFGYTVKDRVGNSLFGQTSLDSGFAVPSLVPGKYLLEYEITWPEVEAGEYTITIGLGDGKHSLHHHIVGWVQSVLKVTSNPSRPVHGAFNNDMKGFSVSLIEPA